MSTLSANLRTAARYTFKIWMGIASFLGSLLMIFLLFIFVAVVFGSSDTSSTSFPTTVITEGGMDEIAVIHVNGVIMDDESTDAFLSQGVVSAKRMKELLRHLDESENVKAVVMRVNSPGGAVVASDELYREIKELNTKKPVVAVFGDTSASGGYYISAGASKIVANPATLTGSIGVIAQFPQLTGLYEKVGVEMRTFKSGEFKDIGSTDRAMSEQENAILQSVITDSYDQFVTAIVEGRKMDEATVRRLGDGRIYTGKQAKENGLIDELGDTDDAIRIASELASIEDPTIMEYSNKSFFESLLSSSHQMVNPLSQFGALIPQSRSGIFYLMEI